MEEIARSARVGVGTLYRRFTDRDALIKAVLEDNLTRLLDETRAAAAEEPTAWQALVRLLTASVRMRLSVHLAVHFRHAVAGDPDLASMRSELLDALDDLVRTAQRDGDLRPDAGTGDVAQLSVLLLRPELPEAHVRRSTAIMIDGLRAAAAAEALPGTPPRLDQTLSGSRTEGATRFTDQLGDDPEPRLPGVPELLGDCLEVDV